MRRLPAICVLALCLAGCHEAPHEIVGAWVVNVPGAPFPLQMYVFHSDGTAEESNPDAGDSNGSDSGLIGAWRSVGNGYRANLVEIAADRATHQFVSRGEISFEIQVRGDTLTGTADASFFDASGRRIRGPIHVKMEGERVRP